MNTEDKFYFGKHGQPERFASYSDILKDALAEAGIKSRVERDVVYVKDEQTRSKAIAIAKRLVKDRAIVEAPAIDVRAFASPGQPEKFTKSTVYELEYHLRRLKKLKADPVDIKHIKDAIAFIKNTISFADEDRVYRKAMDIQSQYFSRPGQPDRFGLEDACWDGYEAVGTKQQDGRTVPNCVPMSKDTHAADDRSADFLRKIAVGVTPSNIKQMQIVVSQALAYGHGKRDTMLIEEAKAAQAEINELKKAGH